MSGAALVLIPSAFEARALLGEDVPAERALSRRLGDWSFDVALCGVGLALAGVLAGRWMRILQPSRVLLTGIAGAYRPEERPVGSLVVAAEVACDGIGAGSLGEFDPLPAHALSPGALGSEPLDRFTLPVAVRPAGPSGLLLSVAAAAGSPAEACYRRARYPDAAAEDMEAFAVALSARDHGISLAVLRGISNVCGERSLRRWDPEAALAACRRALPGWLAQGDP